MDYGMKCRIFYSASLIGTLYDAAVAVSSAGTSSGVLLMGAPDIIKLFT